ncbi:MAG: MoaD family protein [Nitrososphaerota archaeon]|nr:MoaD family protein [Nitrososphaerota archaeon]
MIRVKIAGHLQDYTGGKKELQVIQARDVLGMVNELNLSFPGIAQRILNDQEQIRTYVNVFVNRDNAKDADGERTPLKDGDVVHILPSVAGG